MVSNRFFSSAFLLMMFSAPMLSPGQVFAQQLNTTKDAQLRASFKEGFMKGCLSGKSRGVANQVSFCNCLTDAYNDRYTGLNLAAISSLAGQVGPKGPLIVDVLMTPERQVCTKNNK